MGPDPNKPTLSNVAVELRPIIAMAEFGEEAVAGMAIIARMTPVGFGIIFALSGAIVPIIGQNAGAGLNDRISGDFYEGLLFSAIVVLVVSGLFFSRAPAFNFCLVLRMA